MKKIITLKLLSVLAITVVFTGCGCKNEIQLYLPQDFKDCFVFPAGSWWVYSVNGEFYDTLTLESAVLKPRIEPTEDECEFIESFSSSYSTKLYNNFESYYNINYKKNPTYNGDTVYYSFLKHEWYKYLVGFPTEFKFIKFFGAGLYGLKDIHGMGVSEQREKGGGYWLEAIKDTALGNISLKIIIFRTLDVDSLYSEHTNNIDSLPPFRVYFARGIGMIKKEMYNGDVWTLEDYFINK